jgi:hypothetical protein
MRCNSYHHIPFHYYFLNSNNKTLFISSYSLNPNILKNKINNVWVELNFDDLNYDHWPTGPIQLGYTLFTWLGFFNYNYPLNKIEFFNFMIHPPHNYSHHCLLLNLLFVVCIHYSINFVENNMLKYLLKILKMNLTI